MTISSFKVMDVFQTLSLGLQNSKCNAIIEKKFLVQGLFGDFLFYELKLKLGKGFANKNFPPNFDFHRSHSQLNGWVFPYL